jgi:hypothetical protein
LANELGTLFEKAWPALKRAAQQALHSISSFSATWRARVARSANEKCRAVDVGFFELGWGAHIEQKGFKAFLLHINR